MKTTSFLAFSERTVIDRLSTYRRIGSELFAPRTFFVHDHLAEFFVSVRAGGQHSSWRERLSTLLEIDCDHSGALPEGLSFAQGSVFEQHAVDCHWSHTVENVGLSWNHKCQSHTPFQIDLPHLLSEIEVARAIFLLSGPLITI